MFEFNSDFDENDTSHPVFAETGETTAATDIPASDLDEESAWSDWVLFGRPGAALGILEVSLDLHYGEGSDVVLNALLSARDQGGNVFHRAFESLPHGQFLDPNKWTEWQNFLNQP